MRSDRNSPKSEEVSNHYASGYEAHRLQKEEGKLEAERSRELLARFLPPIPASILDVGGGPGGYACWLAKRGYEVHLIDVTPLHVRFAEEASRSQPDAPLASAKVGDARSLSHGSETIEAVLLFGPLYHLTQKSDRLKALQEAYRVLKPDGILLAVGISRFASALAGVCKGALKDPEFAAIVNRDLQTGYHQNHTNKPEYFMDTFFHHPDELRDEVAEAGFEVAGIYGIEGLSWLLTDFDEWWNHEEYRERLLSLARVLENEPSLLGVSAHLMAVAKK